MEKKLLSVQEVAKRLGVTSETVRRRIREGKMRAERHPNGRDWRVAEAEAVRWEGFNGD